MTKSVSESNAPVATGDLSRRRFLKAGSLAAAGVLGGLPDRPVARAVAAPSLVGQSRPNILFINTDQQGLDTITALGCSEVHTPNMDRLVAGGIAFRQSHTADPVCCPARACWFTGRPAAENGVVMNSYPVAGDMPDLGQCFSSQGYDAFYCGKWHIPGRNPSQSFHFLPAGSGQGEINDGNVSRAAQAFLRNRSASAPFFLTLGFLQPHDICYWIMQHAGDIGELPYPELADELPDLPPNFQFDPVEPAVVIRNQRKSKLGAAKYQWSELHWRDHLWSYYRHVEMVDAEIGRVLDALEDSKHAKNTLVIFTSDHGEGRGRHQTVTKGFLYDQAVKVPLVVAWPGHVPEGVVDQLSLVSGLDFAPTVCDYAKIQSPPKVRGQSLRPLLEQSGATGRESIVSSSAITGRMVRTADYKFITYQDDPVEQLFDISADPWETDNLAGKAGYATVVAEHRLMLTRWESQLEVAPLRKRLR